MHKSKGLEFHSIITVGVVTQTFWGKLAEERCVFFVGVSRAKQRLVSTTADLRPRQNVQKIGGMSAVALTVSLSAS
jgi:superfamily I DNA/RNA helicase